MFLLTRRVFGTCMICLLCAGVLFFTFSPAATAATKVPSVSVPDDFPVYPVIKPNVDFWIDIFTKYSRGEGVVHDVRDLSIIYGVVKLNPENSRKAAKQNRKVKKKAIKYYKAVLTKLAAGKAPATAKEKKVAALFGANPSPSVFKRASHNLRIQTGLKRHFMEGVIRSGALVPEFKKIFKSYGLPEDLVYLPCVESSFNVAAYSKFGAAGIWQFTRSTGRLYMKIGYVVDERRDPFIATHSAAKLLKRNYGELKDWSMALTAYNHGLNGMKRAKKKHKAYPKIYTSYRSRSFKFASRNFYAEFLAAREVAKNYTRYFGDIRLDRPVTYTRFKVDGYVPAEQLAQNLGLSLAKLQKLNPALRKPVFDRRKYIPKGYELRLPKGFTHERVTRAMAGILHTKQKPSKFHRVTKGDTAGAIARTHKVSLHDLIMANGLSRRATIYVGQTLRIPAPGEKAPPKNAQAKSKTPKAPAKETTQAVASAAPETQPVPPIKTAKTKKSVPPKPMKVKPVAEKPAGKTLAPKAAVASVTPAPAPAKETPPVSTIPDTPVEAFPAFPSETPAEAPAKQPEAMADASLQVVTSDLKVRKLAEKKAYTLGEIHVVPGETLGHYADWLGIPTQKIRSLNRLTYGKPISIGQAIKLPLPKSGWDRFEEKRFEYHQEIIEDFFDSYFVAGTDTYEVKSGDTLWMLCANELEIPLWLLQKFNPTINLNALHPRQKLVYPLVNPNGVYPLDHVENLDFRI
ncbi:MAG: LysM peptidoglycan-binding domain-containing protein [Desulfobacterales bacterium]|nr:LysM peptidoglycan-binding domain-containing protein [Desulfobacterales bacterium]